MTITEQIVSQIDAVVQSISNYCGAIQSENQRSGKAKSDAQARCSAQKAKIQQQTDVQVQNLKRTLQNSKNSLNVTYQEVVAFEQELSRIVPRKKVGIIPQGTGSFSAQDAQDLISRIRETGFWAWLKKTLALGHYNTNKKMAAELYGKIDGYYGYHTQQIAAEEQRISNKISACQKNAASQIAAVDEQYRQDIQREATVHSSKVHILAQQEQKIKSDSRIIAIQKALRNAVITLGADPDSWQTYSPSKYIPDDLLVGIALYPCSITSPSSDAVRLLKLLPDYVPTANGFTVPLTVPTNKPVLMYAECESDSIKLAASVYQSIIARLIRFMPPKSFHAVFFDPVNRSTSLGQLIHLSGEGTSQLCEYHLSSQNINSRMRELTEHVDNVCRRLTGAGCTDINTYNAIPNISRIPYTAVVIHDYPNGFDSTSLEYLQVLINKASQCGISIMISHKREDSIEHKSLEVLGLIKQKFDCVKITPQAKASITQGTKTYSYKPCVVNISPTYLSEINKFFTYKAPIDNGFEKFFGAAVPACNDAKNGLDIPFAVDANGSLVSLQIGYDLSAYGFISGGVGSGKTTLLHMIITSAIMHYHPSDLELWLVDYKEAEFAFYTRNCPPHVRYVIADNSSEITYSILDEIEAEISRRQKAFMNAQVKDFIEYSESSYGKAHKMPRLLIVIDEFHRMSQAAQAETEYKIALENIFAEARSHGVVLLLCDQQISNGLSGLSTKSRDLISVRIALRNKAEEVRETLAAENSQITDNVKKLILDVSSGIKGSALYKYEEKDKNDEFANKVIFKSCRGIFATTDDRIAVISKISNHYSGFVRDKTFFIGAVRQAMDVKQILSFEGLYPQNPDVGDRFYIGTPLGIQPCFFFNLKPGESGENIILVGNNHEKRISIIKATLACASRYGYQVKILASKASQLYRQNKEFFNNLSTAEVITSFPQICEFVGKTANSLKAFYSDDDLDSEVSEGKKQLVIFIGLDDIYAQMDASPLDQKTAWTVSSVNAPVGDKQPNLPHTASSFNQNEFVSPESTVHATPSLPDTGSIFAANMADVDSMLALIGQDSDESPADIAPDGKSPFSDALSNIEDMLLTIGQDDFDGGHECTPCTTLSVEDSFAGSETADIKGYNAVNDMSLFFSDGWKIGLNSMIVVDRGTVFMKMRQIKLDGNFNHRIALVMSPDEAQSFMSKTKTMKSLIDSNDTISAVYEYLGGREQCFRPYIFD